MTEQPGPVLNVLVGSGDWAELAIESDRLHPVLFAEFKTPESESVEWFWVFVTSLCVCQRKR